MSMFFESLLDLLAEHYFVIKFVHLVFAAIWAWSTSVAYSNYLLPIFRGWQRAPDDKEKIALRNWAMERFDDGAKLEHIAFPLLLVTGVLMMLAAGWTPDNGWFAMKLVLIVLVFIPIEAMDYYLAHLGCNKEKLRASGDAERYERAIHLHWWFLVVTMPIVIASITFAFFLAVAKPF
ncbi:MAG: hypothetical protein RLN89_08205 [Parvibaculum sp.]